MHFVFCVVANKAEHAWLPLTVCWSQIFLITLSFYRHRCKTPSFSSSFWIENATKCVIVFCPLHLPFFPCSWESPRLKCSFFYSLYNIKFIHLQADISMKQAFFQQRDWSPEGENVHISFCHRPELKFSSQANEVWLLRAVTAFGVVMGEPCISPIMGAWK